MAHANVQELVVNTKQRDRINATGLPIQEHRLPLSNLDMMLPVVDVGVFFIYQNHGGESKCSPSSSEMNDALKRSLGEALVTFYALAGEVVENFAGEQELLCNNRGVDFIEACADVRLADLNLYKAEECLEGKLMPQKKGGVLCIQVTEFKCSGVVVACTFDHRIADAYSANMFLLGWSELARSETISCVPSFRRSLLNPRHPSHYDPSIPHLYIPASSLPPPPTDCDLISRIYNVTSQDIHHLQSLSNAATKLQAFSAFLWQTIAKGMKCDPENTCKMGIVVDGRSRLCHDEIDTYFGNVLGVLFHKLAAKDLRSMELSEIVQVVDGMITEGAKKDHFLGLIDWIEEQRPGGVRPRICKEEEGDGAAFMVSSGRRFPVSKVNFGWGSPAFGSYHFGWGGRVGNVMPMPSASTEGDWVVYVRLMNWQVRALEEESGGIFHPLVLNLL